MVRLEEIRGITQRVRRHTNPGAGVMPKVIIIGAGVTGLSTAYHLAARQGFDVTVIDKGPIGDGSSSRAAGICTGLLWSEAGVRVRNRCFELYERLSRDLAGYEFRRTGCLNLFTKEQWPERTALLPLYDRLKLRYEVLTNNEIRKRWPSIDPPDEVIGLYDPQGGYSEPSEYLPALSQRLREMGVEILEGEPISELLIQSGHVRGVRTPIREIEADAVVCTIYGWTNLLLRRIGLQIPVKAFVHQRYVFSPLSKLAEIPAVNANPLGIYFRPALGNRVLAGIETLERPEFRIPDATYRLDALAVHAELPYEVAERLHRILPCSQDLVIESQHVGLLTFSQDGEPILGPVTAYPWLFLGLAFHSGGFAYNPGTGELLAEYVTDGKTKIDVTTWSPNRFAPDETEEYLAATLHQGEIFRRRH